VRFLGAIGTIECVRLSRQRLPGIAERFDRFAFQRHWLFWCYL
jgi:hypothetical protein